MHEREHAASFRGDQEPAVASQRQQLLETGAALYRPLGPAVAPGAFPNLELYTRHMKTPKLSAGPPAAAYNTSDTRTAFSCEASVKHMRRLTGEHH